MLVLLTLDFKAAEAVRAAEDAMLKHPTKSYQELQLSSNFRECTQGYNAEGSKDNSKTTSPGENIRREGS